MVSVPIRIELTALRCQLLLFPCHESAQLCRGVCSFFFFFCHLRELRVLPVIALVTLVSTLILMRTICRTVLFAFGWCPLPSLSSSVALLGCFNYGNLSFLYWLLLNCLYVSMFSILISISKGQAMAVDNATIEATHIYIQIASCSTPVHYFIMFAGKKFKYSDDASSTFAVLVALVVSVCRPSLRLTAAHFLNDGLDCLLWVVARVRR